MRPAPEPKAAPGTTVPVPVPSSPPAASKSPPPAASPKASPLPPDRPLEPIGPTRMKALREAIRSGRYPSDDAVRTGLERMIRRARAKEE